MRQISRLVILLVVACSLAKPHYGQAPPRVSVTKEETTSEAMKPRVLAMIRHGFESYIRSAFPRDEIRPIQGTGHDTLGANALTLIDSLDLLALVGMHDEFRNYSRWVQDHITFDVDQEVSVFETSIRILGGLLSAHFMYEEGVVAVDAAIDPYDGGLLRLAVELGERLLPAFATPTGIPFGTVNLRNGVPKGEIDITSTAGGGTFVLEMTVLSAVTGDPAFEAAARKATLALVHHRVSSTNLVGNHINITSGRWSLELSSVGSGVDSLIEYLIKGYAFTGDPQLYKGYRVLRDAFTAHTRRGPWFMEMTTNGNLMNPLHNSLASFYPGNIALSGIGVEEAVETCLATHFIMKRQGAIPEGYHLGGNTIQNGQQGYPLRPEHAESIYMLYRVTGDAAFLEMGKEFALMLWTRTATRCGFAALSDCTLPPADTKFNDAMESFLLSETLKYLYLLFDEDNILHRTYTPPEVSNVDDIPDAANDDVPSWIFNTEGHPLPVREEWRWWRLLEEDQTREEEEEVVKRTETASPSQSTERVERQRSFVERIAQTLHPRQTAESRWRGERSQRDRRFDALEREYGKEYAAWSRFDGHKNCSEGNFRCLFDPSSTPQSGPLPHSSIDTTRDGASGFVYRVYDDAEVMDRSFHCMGRQHRDAFSRLSKSLYFDPYEP